MTITRDSVMRRHIFRSLKKESLLCSTMQDTVIRFLRMKRITMSLLEPPASRKLMISITTRIQLIR